MKSADRQEKRLTTSDSIDLITRLRYMLEYMTLCADPTLFASGSGFQPYPVPSGIPMGIVTLPDFVVDVAMDGIRNATGTKRGQLEPLDVGGRAGRLAWVLQQFGGQQNGWYSVKYVAKAGDIGRVVLHRRFAKQTNRREFEPISLRYIVPSKDDHNWLHVYGETIDTVESSHEGLELTLADMDESPFSLTDLFADARYIVIASKYATHAINAVKVVAEGLYRLSKLFSEELCQNPDRRIPLGILVDLSALGNPDDAGRVVESCVELKKRAVAFDVETTALCDRQIGSETGQFEYVLTREGETIRLGDHSETVSGLVGHPVMRESFTAGYVLASSCNLGWKLLRRWCSYFSKIRPINERPHSSFPKADEDPADRSSIQGAGLPSLEMDAEDPISQVNRIKFAALLSRCSTMAPVSYGELVKATGSHSQPLGEIEKQELEHEATPKEEFVGRVTALEEKALLGCGLVPRFDDQDAADTLSLFLPPSDLATLASSCLLRDARRRVERRGEIDKAVMFDLDATLIDSGGMLRACWSNGLRTLFREIGLAIESNDIRTVISIYETFVYNNYECFRWVLKDQPDIPPEWQPCDFRQVWNHRYAWAALLWILDPSQIGGWDDKRWRVALETHKKHVSKEGTQEGCACDVCQRMDPLPVQSKANDEKTREANDGKRRELTLQLRERLIQFKFAIQAARTAFWSVDYPCYPQARSCVQMLRATPGCEVYIVTEGHEETQLKKLRCAGLTDLFSRARVLSTGAASAAEEAGTDLKKLLGLRKRVLEELRKVEVRSSDEARTVLEPLLRTREAAIGSIGFLDDLLSVLYSKAHKRFYSAVIDAIRLKPESPAQVLQSFLEKQKGSEFRRMKFFMIGDRYDNDCKPLLDMNLSNGTAVGIGTCRLLSGKRATAFCPPKSRPHTMYVCDTLAQVGHILHDRAAWERVALLKDVTPPVLLESKDGVILYGPSMTHLATRFRDLSWARADEALQEEPAVRDMLDQIARDLAKCDVASLSRFLNAVREDMADWWRQADDRRSAQPAGNLVWGGLKILGEVNWWWHVLGRPLLRSIGDASETLEWVLGSCLLRCINKPVLRTTLGELRWAPGKSPKGVDPGEVLDALPFSHEGLAVVTALKKDHFQFEKKRVNDWLDHANRLSGQDRM